MRISNDIVQPTPAEGRRLNEITAEQKQILDRLDRLRSQYIKIREEGGDTGELDREINQTSDRVYTLEEEASHIFKVVEDKYIKSHSKAELLADAKKIVDAITQEDFLDHLAFREHIYSDALAGFNALAPAGNERAYKETQVYIAELKDRTIENYDNCYKFIMLELRVQFNAFVADPKSTDKLYSLIDKKASLWYKNPTPTHFPIPYSKPTDTLAYLSPKKASIDPISGDANIERSSVHYKITGYNKLNASLGISTHKLLSTALAVFAKNNDLSGRSKTAGKREVVISQKEYAKLLGYDVDEHETDTPAEAEREKKRAKAQLDNARKKTKKDLDILYNLSSEWQETINGKLESFRSTRLLSSVAYSGGNIYLTFTPEMADYIVSRGILTQYNTKMLAIDERHYNAYRICMKLEEHYNMDINRQNNRHDRIGIDTILAVTDLPSYKEVQDTDRGHWERRIKEPLEENLDYLTQGGFLESWEYTHAKGVPLTDEEAQNIQSYEDYAKLYLLFTPADKVDHTERVRAKQEASQKRKKTDKKKS